MKNIPIIGQEAICPHGLGRVIAYQDKFPEWIKIATYVNNLECEWSPSNVRLVAIGQIYPIDE